MTLETLGIQAKQAERELLKLNSLKKNACLMAAAKGLVAAQADILKANAEDVRIAREKGMKESLVDRLALTEERIASMAEGLASLVALEDPIGEILEAKIRPNGLEIGKKRVPLGVIGIIYESRPNVTADAFGLCFKTSNAVILKGGSDAIHSNKAIAVSYTHLDVYKRQDIHGHCGSCGGGRLCARHDCDPWGDRRRTVFIP